MCKTGVGTAAVAYWTPHTHIKPMIDQGLPAVTSMRERESGCLHRTAQVTKVSLPCLRPTEPAAPPSMAVGMRPKTCLFSSGR